MLSGLAQGQSFLGAPAAVREFRRAPWQFTPQASQFSGTYVFPENGGLPITFTFSNPLNFVNVDGANQSNPDASTATATIFSAGWSSSGEPYGPAGIGTGHPTVARYDRGDQFTVTVDEPVLFEYIRINRTFSGQYLHVEWDHDGTTYSELLDIDDSVNGFLETTNPLILEPGSSLIITNASDAALEASVQDRMRFAGFIVAPILDEEPTYDTIGQADGFTQMMGVNLAGAESTGNGNVPGTYGYDYIYPDGGDLDYFHSKGLDLIRLPFKWERLQRTLSGSLHSAELQRIDDVVALAEARGMKVVLDMHDYGSYDGNGIGSSSVSLSDFEDVWARIADHFEGRSGIYGYGIMNEPNYTAAYWPDVADAAIAGIRQHDSDVWVIVSGGGWAPTRGWYNYNHELHNNLDNLDDKVMFEAHSYLDQDGGGYGWGSYAGEEGHPMKGVWRDYPFVNWLRENDLYGLVGEFGVPEDDSRWIDALENQVHHLGANGVSATYWVAGPWSVNAEMSIQPKNNFTTDRPQMAVMGMNYALRAPGGAPPSSSGAIAKYDFENASNLGEDSSGNGATHNGNVNGSPSQDSSDAKIGSSSIRMYGDQNQYIEVPDHSELDSTDQLTIAFWAKPTATGLDTNARGIISKRADYNDNVSYSLFLPSSGSELKIYLDDGSGAPESIPTGYNLHSNWQHIVMVFDGTLASSNRVRVYVDGSLHGTHSHSASQIRDLNSPLTIGSLNPDYNPGGGYVSYDGWLDDIQVHRNALSASEVSDLYAEGGGSDEGPVAYFDFENGSNLGDDTSVIGSSHDGSVNGSPSLDSSESRMGNSSIRMYGDQNQYIEVPDHSELDDTEALTIAFWAKPTSTGIDGNARGLISKRADYNDNVSYSLYLPSSGGELTIYLDDGSGAPSKIPTGYTFQTDWQHVAMVFDGTEPSSSRVRVYVDGSLHGTYLHSAAQIRDLNSPLTIGSLNPDYNPGGNGYVSFDGWMDDVRIYRRALSASEVADLHGVPAAAYWTFDETSGTTVGDSSANSLDVSMQGTNTWTSGQVDGALDIGDAANAYGMLTDPVELENTDKLSISFWVRPENLDGNARFVVSKRDAEDVNASYSVFFWTGNRLFVDLDKNNNGNRHSTDTQFQNDAWYHVAVVYDGTLPQAERGRVYINGDLDANSPFSVSSSSIPDYASDFFLGIANSGYARSFGGRIDDLLIFREALYESEVESLGGF